MENLQKKIKKFKNTPQTLINILDKMPKDISKGILYSNLKNYRNLNEIFEKKKILLVLLDPPNKNVGHFIIIIKKNQMYEIFGGYGLNIKSLINILKLDDILLRMLSNINYSNNKYHYEQLSRNIKDCGLYCIVRAYKWYLSNKEFNYFFQFPGLNSDNLVSLLTIILF